MASVTADLGRYVVRQGRPNGKVDFNFRVPARLRPKNWAKNIRLPRDETKRTRDASPTEVACVIQDGEELNALLDAARQGAPAGGYVKGSLPWLMTRFRQSGEWPAKKKTVNWYEGAWNYIEPWSKKNGHKSVTGLKWPRIYNFIIRFESLPAAHRQVRTLLRKLCAIAVDEGIIPQSPFLGQERRRWKTKASEYSSEAWEYAHVRKAVKAFLKSDRRSLAIATLIGFELMQYPEQIAGFRRGEHYDARTGEFCFKRNKTGQPCRVTVSRTLRWFLRDCDLYLVVSEETGRPYTEGVLAKTFRRMLKGVKGLNTFQMRWLRHSGVFEARRSGLDIETIADIGAWATPKSVDNVINKNYRLPDGKLASEGQRKREEYRNAERTKSFTLGKKRVSHV